MRQILSEDKLRPLEINFYKLKNNRLQESFLAMFGGTLKAVLKRMFGKIPSPEEYKDHISENEGVIDFTAPSASGDIIRVAGYGTDTANVIYLYLIKYL